MSGTLFVSLAECVATEWSQWSVCSVSCGFGQRFRKRKYSDLTVNVSSCDLALLESETCSGWCHVSNSLSGILDNQKQRHNS